MATESVAHGLSCFDKLGSARVLDNMFVIDAHRRGNEGKYLLRAFKIF